MKVKVVKNILDVNDRMADANRRILAKAGVFAVNLMSAPGAGKTTLLERTIRSLGERIKFGVIEGDIQGTHDAEVIAALDVPVVQINTEGACHLDANMISAILPQLPLDALDVLVVENVGNLVCPAEFDVGESVKVMILSLAEGDDKPMKYPLMFQQSEVLIINKIDLAPYLDARVDRIREDSLALNPSLKVFEVSAKSGEGFEGWLDWIENRARQKGA